MSYIYGHESIPANWYRKPVDYSLVDLVADVISFGTQYPELLSVGGNTGSVNSFTGIDISNLTGGVFNAETLLEDNNLLCFVFEVVKWVTPSMLSGLFATVAGPLSMITDALSVPLLNLSCPALEDVEMGGANWLEGIEALFPGAAKSSGGL